jgi:hypothetical protein
MLTTVPPACLSCDAQSVPDLRNFRSKKTPPQPTMMLEESIINNHSSDNAMTFNKVSASGRVSEVLACSCSTYAGRPPSWV